jgi:acyl carrier protein
MIGQIRSLIARTQVVEVSVEQLSDVDDLFEAGLTSLGAVELLMSLEEAFGVEFPEDMVTRETLASIAALQRAVESLTGGSAPP